jgi:beta-1,4-mannosyltransferase
MSPEHNRRVAVVVLGDFGRSPRMQYHAVALADSHIEVDVVAYAGSAPLPLLREHPRVRLHLLPPPRLWKKTSLPSALTAALMALRVCKQSLQLLWMLGLRVLKPDFILVQNPPAIPTLLVALIAARVRSARLVIDWHNFGCSMLAMQLRQGNPASRLARWYEQTLGRCGDGHLCVSEAMRSELAEHWGIPGAIVLYDRPAAQFAPTPPDVRQDLFRRVGAGLDFPWDRDRCPGLIVYPTSWTVDEDFSLLLEAAAKCDEMISCHDQRHADDSFTHLLIVITGQGPLRDHYQQEIARLRLKKVHLRTLWLTPEDYPLMLGAADLGSVLPSFVLRFRPANEAGRSDGCGRARAGAQLWRLPGRAVARGRKRLAVRERGAVGQPTLRIVQRLSGGAPPEPAARQSPAFAADAMV